MKKIILTTAIAGIAAAPAAMAAPTSVPAEGNEAHAKDFLSHAIAEKSRPAEVADAMKALGMEDGEMAFSSVLFDSRANPAINKADIDYWCTSRQWCVAIETERDETLASSGVSTELKERLAARQEEGSLTLSEILEEMDGEVEGDWSVVMGENGTAIIS